MDIPLVNARIPVPEMRMPTTDELNSAVDSAVDSVRSQLPDRDQSLFYGALALGVAFAFIEWPVALAIGVGHALLNSKTQQSA